MSGEYDLQLVSGDLAFGPDDEPLFLSGTDAVAQDIRHRLLESGLGPELVGDDEPSAVTRNRIAATVEEDERIRPGTARVESATSGQYTATAETMDGAAIAQTVSA